MISNPSSIVKSRNRQWKIGLLELELIASEPQKTEIIDISPIVKEAVKTLLKINRVYESGPVETKKIVINTIFSQKVLYNSGIGRTQNLNIFAEVISLINSELLTKKWGKIIRKCLCPIKGL